jgi:hypothetical protein
MHKEIKSSLNSGNGCYYEVQSILSSRLLSRNVKVKLIQKHNSASCFVWVWNAVSTLREEHRLEGIREQGSLENIWDEVTRECRKLQEKLHNLSSSQNIIKKIKSRRIRWAGHVVRMAERKVYKVLVGKLGGKTPLGRPRRRWDGTKWILGRLAAEV